MPGSALSYGTHSSGGSKSRARTRQYRTVAYQSQVDESLFGTPDRVKQRNGNNNGPQMEEEELYSTKLSPQKKSSRKPKKEQVQVITKDLIRNLLVPDDDPSGESVVLSFGDYLQIRDRSRVLSKEEREAQALYEKQSKETLMRDAADRKDHMQAMELQRQKNEPLNDLEEEANKRAHHLLENANEQRQEREDEIKHLNELILQAKCSAIRDAQLLEKVEIGREMTEEEKRLDAMMEIERLNAIRMQEEIERQRKEERLVGAQQILGQISENEQERLFDLERKDQENIQMQKYLNKLMEEDRDKIDRRKLVQDELRDELNKANVELLDRKKVIAEQDKILEARVLQYQKEKAEREAAFELEEEQKRIEKEKETARLRGLQERAQDEQASRDALRAKRASEEAEREWRRKEATAAQKKAEIEAMLKVARSEQMEQKEHFISVQAQRERADFERVLRAQKELIEKEQREEKMKITEKISHRDDVISQIRQKEREKISERNAFFEEGVRLDEEARQRRSKIDQVKMKKIKELRAAGIPEKYLAQVERKVGHQQPAGS